MITAKGAPRAGSPATARRRSRSGPSDPVHHGFAPVLRADALVLVLGSFPSVASLGAGQYYAHPRNQFWPLIGEVIGVPIATLPYEDRLERLRANRVALWDVVGSCRRAGSLDASIRDPIANRFDALLAAAPGLRAVAFNGATAARHADWFAARGLATFRMPSTSPAHASLGFAAKRDAWIMLRALLDPTRAAR